MENRFVVVDVVDSYDDLGGAAERVRPTGRIVICGCDVDLMMAHA